MLWYVCCFVLTVCHVSENTCAYWQANCCKRKRFATKQECTAPTGSAVTLFRNGFTLSEISNCGVKIKHMT